MRSAHRSCTERLNVASHNEAEARNVSADHAERVAELRAKHEAWSATLRKPLWGRYKDESDD